MEIEVWVQAFRWGYHNHSGKYTTESSAPKKEISKILWPFQGRIEAGNWRLFLTEIQIGLGAQTGLETL
ncbi:hypothetical protein SCOR_20010 [Sulfidibacter corallicola]